MLKLVARYRMKAASGRIYLVDEVQDKGGKSRFELADGTTVCWLGDGSFSNKLTSELLFPLDLPPTVSVVSNLAT